MTFLAIPVPNILKKTVYFGIDIIKLLKLVYYQIVLHSLAQIHKKAEQFPELKNLGYVNIQRLPDFRNKTRTKVGFIAPAYKQVNRRRAFTTLKYQTCFSDTPPPGQHQHLRVVEKRHIAHFFQCSKFFFPIIKLHIVLLFF